LLIFPIFPVAFFPAIGYSRCYRPVVNLILEASGGVKIMTQTEIIDAAFRVWGRDFYQNTSLSDLARELKVSKTALYRHFTNKQALLAAMTGRFFDEFADCIRSGYERAFQLKDRSEGVAVMLRSTAEYYARNAYGLIFSLINVYDRDNAEFAAAEEMRKRGIDMEALHRIIREDYSGCTILMQLIFATLTFFMAHFHETGKTFTSPPDEQAINETISAVLEIITKGLGYTGNDIDTLDYGELENCLAGTEQNIEDDPLLKAVAGAVAEAGPWGASMEQVARRSGLSKSSLYGHFKSKKDMLRQLFITEFKRIIAFAKAGIARSDLPAGRLYLGIFSIIVYLRSRPEILTTLDWVRTRKLDFGPPKRKADFYKIFEGIQKNDEGGGGYGLKMGGKAGDDEDRTLSHWILFLIINILMKRRREHSLADMPDSDARVLFRYVTLGLQGFHKK
jgi:AcrR family transcriptional regulator